MSDPSSNASGQPITTSPTPLLTDAEATLLVEARTAKWLLESYEHAYDTAASVLSHRRVLNQFLGVASALIFLYLRWLARDNSALHEVLGNIGAAFSLLFILASIWIAYFRWQDQIEKKRALSADVRKLLGKYRKATDPRPVDDKKIRAWLAECHDFEQERKHEMANLDRYFMIRGFQHLGKLYPKDGVTCTVCGKVWTPQTSDGAWRIRFPWLRCEGCGRKKV